MHHFSTTGYFIVQSLTYGFGHVFYGFENFLGSGKPVKPDYTAYFTKCFGLTDLPEKQIQARVCRNMSFLYDPFRHYRNFANWSKNARAIRKLL